MTKVAIMGYGVVGSGLIELIDKNREKCRKIDKLGYFRLCQECYDVFEEVYELISIFF